MTRTPILLLIGILGCAAPVASDQRAPADAELRARSDLDGTPVGVGMLAFLNDPTTTYTVLDDEVPLNKLAARNLIAHRDGADRVAGTSDDNLFGDVEEVDAVRYVGPATLTALETYAEAHGWDPSGSDTLGTWDGVSFTVDEATATLAVANTATYTELDVDVPLDSRAARSIYAARPIANMPDLADLYYVGSKALTALKAYAAAATVCDPTLTPVSNATADDYDTLVAAATTIDYPAVAVTAYEVPGCTGWADDATASAAIVRAVFDATITVAWDDVPSGDIDIDPIASGGTTYTSYVASGIEAVDERVTDGDWDPTADATLGALYDERATIEADLDAPATASGAREIAVLMDASECSERLALLVSADGGLLVVHTFPRC